MEDSVVDDEHWLIFNADADGITDTESFEYDGAGPISLTDIEICGLLPVNVVKDNDDGTFNVKGLNGDEKTEEGVSRKRFFSKWLKSD